MKINLSDNYYLRIIISVGTFFAIIYFFRYIGLKGILGFVVGMFVMTFLFLSKNPLIRFIIQKSSGSEEYIDVINKGE